MTNTDLDSRRTRYFDLSSRIAQIDNQQLAALLGDKGPARGWGATHTVKIGPSKVFVKRIPLTELEHDNLFSTANWFGMPTFYNYGVGSAGFGAFRELVTHIKTTNWVLEGSIPNFPLMYHYRIVPFGGERAPLDEERHAGYIKYWNSDAAIDRYLRARTDAKYEVVLFLEHFPHVLQPWLGKNLDKSATVIPELLNTFRFLREHGVIQFDAHFWNIVCDDTTAYVTDFGLALDKSFTLTPEEKAFFQKHIDYDDAEFLACLAWHAHSLYKELSPNAKAKLLRRYGIAESDPEEKQIAALFDHLESIHADGILPLDDVYVQTLITHRPLIETIQNFYVALRQNDRKDTRYPHAKILRQLQEAGLH